MKRFKTLNSYIICGDRAGLSLFQGTALSLSLFLSPSVTPEKKVSYHPWEKGVLSPPRKKVLTQPQKMLDNRLTTPFELTPQKFSIRHLSPLSLLSRTAGSELVIPAGFGKPPPILFSSFSLQKVDQV